MENFVVSARKYRPDTFETVVGQPAITKTLKNAIKSGQLAHAYLFCGPRGVGKTTCARIFAKTINCQTLGDDTEACGNCESCQSFAENRSFTIHELDAASNNHVDDIRNLIDQVRIPPQVGKYSIYIIDEVHMLSQQAFNAFLKTLEEPPAHAIFVLATTEKHKIIPTILSRCQIFDFNRIKVGDMMNHLRQVADSEQVEAEEAALNIIAQKADGSMRDALSIFDQVVSFSGKTITYQTVVDNLNVLDYDYYFTLTEAFLAGNYRNALMIYNEILDKGFDSHNFINGLGGHFRNLLVSKDQETIALLELSGEIAEKYLEVSQNCLVDWLFKALSFINQSDIGFKQAKDPRLHVEICLLRISRIQDPRPKTEDRREEVRTKTEDRREEVRTKTEDLREEVRTKTEDLREEVSSKAEDLREEVSSKAEESKKEEGIKAGEKSVISGENGAANGLKKTTSVSDFLNKKKNGEDVGDDGKPKDEAVESGEPVECSPELIREKWTSFADDLKKDQPRLYNTLIAQLPDLNDDEVKVKLNNPLQAKALKSVHNELQGYLRKTCGNPDLTINYEIESTPAMEKKLYTQEEKYKHLLEKNPDLDTFRQTFKLDFE